MPDPIAILNRALEGRYTVEREIGRGGMATVYLAHDVRHDRQVAIKVLKTELAAVIGGDRFLAEIKTTATLNHPHILPLFDSGQADGLLYYVMPFVEGESIRDRLVREKQLPVEETVRIAADVAEALDHAHRHGVIHRDVKPANILLQDGRPLVADFGIALAVSAAGGGRLTETGLSMGTPYYMSPEQATGDREVDARSDVYALGCVVYEMLTGEPPHPGATAQAVLGRILMGNPTPPTEHRRAIPAHVEAAVMQSLEKLPADRFASAAAFARALQDSTFRRDSRTAAVASAQEVGRWKRMAAAAGALAVLAVAGLIWSLTARTGDGRAVRYDRIVLGSGLTRVPGLEVLGIAEVMALAPDGGGFVFPDTVGMEGGTDISYWWKARDRIDPVRIAGMERALAPVFSPDGEWLAYVKDGQLRKQRLQGGASVLLADSVTGGTIQGLAWLEDGTLVFENTGYVLERVSENGETAELVSTEEDVGRPIYVSGLLGGGAALVVGCLGGCGLNTTLLSLVDFERDTVHALAPDVRKAWHMADGHVVYVDRVGAVFAAALDRTAGVLGPPIPLFDGVRSADAPEIEIGLDGSLVYTPGTLQSVGLEPVWVGRTGQVVAVDQGWVPIDAQTLALAHDDQRLAVSIATDEGENLWIKELPAGPLVPVTVGTIRDRRPVWSTDGTRLLYIAIDTAGYDHVRTVLADGSATNADTLLMHAREIYEVAPSADGRYIVFRMGDTGVNDADVAYTTTGDGADGSTLLDSQFNEHAITLSPDGRWLAYLSEVSGRQELYVRPFPGDGPRVPISRDGATEPLWGHGGGEIFFRTPDGWMNVAHVRGDATFRVDSIERLFDARPYAANSSYRRYDVTADDQRFVMLRATGSETADEGDLIYVEGWYYSPEIQARLRAR